MEFFYIGLEGGILTKSREALNAPGIPKYFTRLVQWLEAKEMNVFVPRFCRACVRSINIEEKNIKLSVVQLTLLGINKVLLK